MNGNKKNSIFLAGFILFLFVVGIPLGVFLTQKKQETRSHASGSTTLSFSPSTTSASPTQKKVGDTVSFDIVVDPGNSQVSFVKLEMDYDPTKLQPATTPFTSNPASFPDILEGPIVNNGKIQVSVSVGPDPSKVITQIAKVGTINFTAISQTPDSQPVSLSFGSGSTVLSTAPGDQASENVLSTTIPAYLSIASTETPTPTVCPGPGGIGCDWTTPALTQAPSITPVCAIDCQEGKVPFCPNAGGCPNSCDMICVQPSLTPTPSGSTSFSLNVFMHGIGDSGDNVNPTGSSLSNKDPIHKTRFVGVQFIDSNSNEVVGGEQYTGVVYSSASGSFKGTLNFPYIDTSRTTGPYIVKIKEPTHLRALFSGSQNVVFGQNNTLPNITLITGDIIDDNRLDILDYNQLMECFSVDASVQKCTDTVKKMKTDINDDGLTDPVDYNLFLREISVQSGQ